jgi:RNA polymerase sigma-70 factor (ECF subfamily)
MLADPQSETASRSNADSARDVLAERLIAAGRGDRAAFRALYEATSAKLFGACLRICSDREIAEDALQDAYIAIWKNAARFDRQRSSPITWLVAIARNRAIDRMRASGKLAQARPIEEAEALPDPEIGADVGVERSQAFQQLEHCLGELEPRHAGLIRTAFWEGRTYDSLAESAGVPLGTVKSWVRRGLQRLRACLDR